MTSEFAEGPPWQKGRFEKLADWLFARRKGDAYLVIRSFPFNVIELTEGELKLLKNYLNGQNDLPTEMREILSENHFLDPEPNAETYLTNHSSAILVMTTACNLKCSGCFASGGDYGLGIGHMSEAVIDATISYLAQRILSIYQADRFTGKSNLGLHFFGGEPLIAFDRIRYAVERTEENCLALSKQCGVPIEPDFFVTTNGTLLKPDKIRFFKDHQTSVLLSIDGPTHDERRKFGSGKGSLANVIDAFRALRAEGICTRLNTVVLGEDIINFKETLDWFRSEVYKEIPELSTYHTFSFQREGPGSPLGDCGTSYSPDKIEQYVEDLLDFNSLGYQIYETQLRKKLSMGGTFYKCSSGVKRIAISPEGRVYPCQGFIDKDFDMGSILDPHFKHRLTPISGQFAKRNIATLVPCRNCVFSSLCPHNVDCAARAHYTLGGMQMIDVNGMCRVGYELMDRILFQGEKLW